MMMALALTLCSQQTRSFKTRTRPLSLVCIILYEGVYTLFFRQKPRKIFSKDYSAAAAVLLKSSPSLLAGSGAFSLFAAGFV